MEQEILSLWKSGFSKNKIAEIYRKNYNMHLKIVRSEMHNRHAGKLLSKYDALSIVERIIYRYVMNNKY